MSCVAFERLAAAASGDDEAILAHVDDCSECRDVVGEQSEIRALAAQLVTPPLSRAHRERLAAEVMARADWMPQPRRRMVPLVGAGLAAAAAFAIALGLGAFRGSADEPEVAHVVTPSEAIVLAPRDEIVVNDIAPPAPRVTAERRTAKLGGTGEYTHDVHGEREVVTLATGELTVDATDARPVRVVSGDTQLSLRRARVTVIATKGAIAQVSVFSGSAEISVGGKTVVIEAGTIWERPATPADSSTAFQEGWAALRDGKNAEAIAAFDRAVDPIVAEDALYWGAIASERIEDTAGAKQRYELLLEQFPTSPRARKVKKALARLAD